MRTARSSAEIASGSLVLVRLAMGQQRKNYQGHRDASRQTDEPEVIVAAKIPGRGTTAGRARSVSAGQAGGIAIDQDGAADHESGHGE